MLKKLLWDIKLIFNHNPVYQISTLLKTDQLEYPFIFNETEIRAGKKQRLISDFDNDGIPLIKSYIDVDDNDLHYYPITIGQVGLSTYQTYLNTKLLDDKHRFLKFVAFFETSVIIEDDLAYWVTDVPKPEYEIHAPWKSAFTQSRAISILLRGYFLTEKTIYLEIIEKALNLYDHLITSNGVSVKTPFGLFYEEYATEEPTMVLDGHLFSMFGLIDILKAKSKLPKEIWMHAESLFNKGILAIKDTFSLFDLGFWMKFNLCQMAGYPKIDPCTVGYMKLIHCQFDMLHQFTEDSFFKEKAIQIQSYLTVKNSIKAYIVKFKALKALNRI